MLRLLLQWMSPFRIGDITPCFSCCADSKLLPGVFQIMCENININILYLFPPSIPDLSQSSTFTHSGVPSCCHRLLKTEYGGLEPDIST